MATTTDKITLQTEEFNAVEELAKRWHVLQQIAVVDDDYPAARHYYESAVRAVITAFKNNGRIKNAP